MLFAALLKSKPGAVGGTRRRMEAGYSEDSPVVAEYWLQSPDPAVIVVCKADHIGQLWAVFAPWRDLFEVTIVPAIEAQEGLELLKQLDSEGKLK